MGFLTPVLPYNDSISNIKDDPYFMEELSRGADKDKDIYVRSYRKTWVDALLAKMGLYRKPKRTSWRSSSSCAQVLNSLHADVPRVLVVHGNTWVDLCDLYCDSVNLSTGGLTEKGKERVAHIKFYKECVDIAQMWATKGKQVVKLIKEQGK